MEAICWRRCVGLSFESAGVADVMGWMGEEAA